MSKKIYVYSPSGAVRDKAAFHRGIKHLQRLGFEIEIDSACLNQYQRFAGTDEERLASIHRAAQSKADIALISRGGYGLTRLLDDIDYLLIAKAITNGMQFVGFSDFTSFQSAVLAQTGQTTWAGPSLGAYFGAGGLLPPNQAGKRLRRKIDEITEACFLEAVHHQSEGVGWHQSKSLWNPSISCNYQDNIEIKNATLWGGNLSVLCFLIGSKYFPTIQNGILFLEDIGEYPFQIERLLTQLLNSNVLHQQRALVLGQFTGYKLSANDKGFNLKEVIHWLGKKINIPIITNLPFGHVDMMVMLPIGKSASLICEGQDAMIFWGSNHTHEDDYDHAHDHNV